MTAADSAPFDINLVIARLADQVPTFRQVRGAADYAAITKINDFAPPESFVLLARERGTPNPGNTRQKAAAFFGVVIAVRNFKYERGAKAMDDLGPFVGAVRNALIGWIPNAPGARGCMWVQGDMLDYSQGTILWSEVFSTQHFVGSPS